MTITSPAAASGNVAVVVCSLSAFPEDWNAVPKNNKAQCGFARFGQQWVNLNPTQRKLVEMAITTPASDGRMKAADKKAIVDAYETAATLAGQNGEIIAATGHGGAPAGSISWADFGAQLGKYQDHTACITSDTFSNPQDSGSKMMLDTLDEVATKLKAHGISCVNFYNCSISNDTTFCNNIKDRLKRSICTAYLYNIVRGVGVWEPDPADSKKKKKVWKYEMGNSPQLNGIPKKWSREQWPGNMMWYQYP